MRTFDFARHTRSAGVLLAGLAAGGVLAAGGMAVAAGGMAVAADDATGGTTSSGSTGTSSSAPRSSTDAATKTRAADETALSGDTLQSVKDAVLAEYPGSTFDRVETDRDGVYEAHITKSDGTRVTVELDKNFAITGEETGGGRGGHGGADRSNKGGPGECPDDTKATPGADATEATAAS